MSISEQVKELRNYERIFEGDRLDGNLSPIFGRAADTIESLSEKLETANKELERWHTDKINDKIKNPFACTSTLYCHNCDHKDEYIEELEASDMERSAEDCDGWILCKVSLPEEGQEVILQDYYGNREIGRFGHNEDYQEGFYIGDWFSTSNNYLAWHEFPEPYHEP